MLIKTVNTRDLLRIIDTYQAAATPLGWYGKWCIRKMFAGERLGVSQIGAAYVLRVLGRPLPPKGPTPEQLTAAALVVARGLNEGFLEETLGPRNGRGWRLVPHRFTKE